MPEPIIDSAPWPVPPGSLCPESLRETLEAIGFLGERLEFDVVGLLDDKPENDPEVEKVWMHDLAVVVDRLESIIDKAKEVQQAAAVAFCRALPYPAPSNVSYADTRPLIPRFPKNRTAWRNDELASAVRARVLAQVEETVGYDGWGDDGDEVGKTAAQAAAVTLGQMERIVTLSGGNAKTTGIKALGLDPDDFCTSEKQDPTIQVVK